jgi:hypothetical protein
VRFELEFEDTFDGAELDASRWLPYYLPHWSSRERAAARYEAGGGLRLLIEADQEPWSPELDGAIRVSSLQTGAFAGPLGSAVGQHRFHPDAVVRETQPNVRLYTPQYGRIEVRARASADPDAMVSLWMPGYEGAERSGEICVMEIFGRDVSDAGALVGVGVHPFGDPALADDFAQVPVPIDVTEPHDYRADWTPDGVVFAVDGVTIKSTVQSPRYPLQVMLGIYEFPEAGERRPEAYPKEFVVEAVRGYRLAA